MAKKFHCPNCNVIIKLTDTQFKTKLLQEQEDDEYTPNNTFGDFTAEGMKDDDPWNLSNKKITPKKPKKVQQGPEEFDIGGIIFAETEKAYGIHSVTVGGEDDDFGGDSDEKYWLPKSHTTKGEDMAGFTYFTIPLWLAKAKGFIE